MTRWTLTLLPLAMLAGCSDPLHDLLEDSQSNACFYACASGTHDCFDDYGQSEADCRKKATTLCGAAPARLTYLPDAYCYDSEPDWYRYWGADAFVADPGI